MPTLNIVWWTLALAPFACMGGLKISTKSNWQRAMRFGVGNFAFGVIFYNIMITIAWTNLSKFVIYSRSAGGIFSGFGSEVPNFVVSRSWALAPYLVIGVIAYTRLFHDYVAQRRKQIEANRRPEFSGTPVSLFSPEEKHLITAKSMPSLTISITEGKRPHDVRELAENGRSVDRSGPHRQSDTDN